MFDFLDPVGSTVYMSYQVGQSTISETTLNNAYFCIQSTNESFYGENKHFSKDILRYYLVTMVTKQTAVTLHPLYYEVVSVTLL